MVELIQGEAGIIVPDDGNLKGIRAVCGKYNVVCDKYNIVWIADGVQSGLGRTSKRVATDWEDVKPDLITLAKALSFFPLYQRFSLMFRH